MNDAITLSGMLTRWRELEVRATNLANAETPGFQALHMQAVAAVVAQPGGGPATSLAYAGVRGTWRDSEPGPIQRTGNALDMALGSNGYFTVMTAGGPRLTRDGHFTLDSSGTIVDQQGHPLLDSSGQNLSLTAADGRPSIAGDGTISGRQGIIGKVGVVAPANPQAVSDQGGTLLTTTSPTAPVGAPHVVQGAVAGSSTSAIQETVGMIQDTREFQLIAAMLKAEATRRSDAIQKIMTAGN